MLEFEINCTFRGRESDGFDNIRKRNLIYFSNVLEKKVWSRKTPSMFTLTHLSYEMIQESLGYLISMGMPIKAVDFTEGVEMFNASTRCQIGIDLRARKCLLVCSLCRLFALIKDSLD
jgi:hypothetical protein